MGDSTVLTEEVPGEREAEVVTSDGIEPEIDESTNTVKPTAGGAAAAAPDDDEDDTDADAEGDDDEDDEDEGQSGDKRPPRRSRNSVQKSVDRLTKQKGELERSLAEERGRRLALEELVAKGTMTRAQADAELNAADEPPEPQAEDYDSVEEYAKAYSKWEREAETAKANPKTGTAGEGQQSWQPSRESIETRQKSHEAAVAVFEDFDERMEKVGPKLTLPIMQAIEFDEDGALICAHLADHPDELERLRTLTDPKQLSKAIQRFAGKVLDAGAAPSSRPNKADSGVTTDDEPPRTSRKPTAVPTRAKPVGTVLNGGRVSAERDVDSMSQDEYEEYMNSRERRNRR